jgi:hypothetical protein
LLIFSLLGIDGWYLAVDGFESTLELDPLASTVVVTVATTVRCKYYQRWDWPGSPINGGIVHSVGINIGIVDLAT